MNLCVFGDPWVQLCEAVSVVKMIGGKRDCVNFVHLSSGTFWSCEKKSGAFDTI